MKFVLAVLLAAFVSTTALADKPDTRPDAPVTSMGVGGPGL